jgi:negative regulator of sigma E activity
MNDAELARNYILDRLSEEERDECERRFLSDAEFEFVMQEQERALLDDYVNLRLSTEDADAVLRRVAQQPGQLFRLRFAESLKRAAMASAKAGQSKVTPWGRWLAFLRPRPFLWLGGLAGVAGLAVIVILAVTALHGLHSAPAASSQTASAPATQVQALTGAQTTPQPNAASTAPAAPAQAREPKQITPKPAIAQIATLALLANQQRGESEIPTLTLRSGLEQIRLQLTTEEGLSEGPYDARIETAQGAQAFATPGLPLRRQAGRGYVELDVPAAALASGEYSVELTPRSGAPVLNFRFALAPSQQPSANPQ